MAAEDAVPYMGGSLGILTSHDLNDGREIDVGVI